MLNSVRLDVKGVLTLPGVGPELSAENILQSISAALHVNTGPVVGQAASKQAIMKNPGIMDTQQPHVQQVWNQFLSSFIICPVHNLISLILYAVSTSSCSAFI